MFSHRRCTGLIGGLLLWLLSAGPFLYGQTPEAMLAAGDYAAAARAFSARGERADHFAAGEAWLAIDSLELARTAFQQVTTGAIDSLAGLAWHKIGLSHYYAFDDAGAAAAYRRAIAVRDAVFPDRHLDRAKSRGNLAGTLIFLGQTDSAGLYLRQAIDIYANIQPTDTTNWLRSLANLMQVSGELQDYQVGMSAANSAVDLLRAATGIKGRDQRSVRYQAASTYFRFGDVTAAKTNARHLERLARTHQDPTDLMQAYYLLALIADREENTADAIRYGELAITTAEQHEISLGPLCPTFANLAYAYGKAGQLDRAASYADRADAVCAENHPEVLPALANIRGELARKRGQPEAALTAFDRGLRMVEGKAETPAYERYQPDPDSIQPDQLENAVALLGERATTLAELGRDAEALRDYSLLFTVQDLLRGRVSSDASRRYLSSNLRIYFDRAIDLWVKRYRDHSADGEDLWRAIELSERAKAYTLLTSLRRDRTTMPAREATLRTRIAELEREAATDASRQPQLEAVRLQLDRLIRLTGEDPELPTVRMDRTRLAALLPRPGDGLLIFHLGAANGHVFLLRKAADGQLELNHREIPAVASLSTAVEGFRTAILQSAYRRKSLRPQGEQMRLDSAYLYRGLALAEQVFGKESEAFRPALPQGALTIIPDGALNFLPFGSLPMRTADLPLRYATVDYFQGERQINYAYSTAFLLTVADRATADYSDNLLAFAPEFRGNTSVEEASRTAAISPRREGERSLPGLSPLRYNQEEVSAITAMIPDSRPFLAAAADRESFLKHAARARILHLSTHGMVNAANPLLSFVAFSQLGDSLELEEMLYFNDLSVLPIPAELAVLSACETNLGAYVPGETTLSLASAFAAAGARSTLTTLWQVDDAATKELMVGFYRSLANGQDRGSALQSAQAEHRGHPDYAHPYYWSAFTLYGNAGPLPLAAASTPWWLYGLLTLLAGGALLLLGRYFLRR